MQGASLVVLPAAVLTGATAVGADPPLDSVCCVRPSCKAGTRRRHAATAALSPAPLRCATACRQRGRLRR